MNEFFKVIAIQVAEWVSENGILGFIIFLIVAIWFVWEKLSSYLHTSKKRKLEQLNEAVDLTESDKILSAILRQDRLSFIFFRNYGCYVTVKELSTIKAIMEKIGDEVVLNHVVKAVKYYKNPVSKGDELRPFTAWDWIFFALPNLFGSFVVLFGFSVLLATVTSIVFPEVNLLSVGEGWQQKVTLLAVMVAAILMSIGGALFASITYPFRYAKNIKALLKESVSTEKTVDLSQAAENDCEKD